MSMRVSSPAYKSEPTTAQMGLARRTLDLDLGDVSFNGIAARLSGTIVCGAELTSHGHESELRTLHLEWVRRSQLCSPGIAAKLQFWKLWSDCAPQVSAERASIIADYCLMYTVLDDGAEAFFRDGSLRTLDQALRNFQAVLVGRAPMSGAFTDFPRYGVLCDVLADLHRRLASPETDAVLQVLGEGFGRYRRGVVQQAYLAQRGQRVSRETQLYNRLLNVAYEPTITLLCIVNGFRYPDLADGHPMLERLHTAFCRIGAIINDIISFPKEAGEHATCQNLIAAYHDELANTPLHNPLQTAIARTVEFHNREFEDCLSLGEMVMRDAPSLASFVQLGVDMHQSWMNWCLNSSRYIVAATPQPTVAKNMPVGAPLYVDRASAQEHASAPS